MWVNNFLKAVAGCIITLGKIAVQGCTFLPTVKHGLTAYMPFLQTFLTQIVYTPIVALGGRESIGADIIAPLAAIHRLQTYDITPFATVAAYLKDADIGQRLETIAGKFP